MQRRGEICAMAVCLLMVAAPAISFSQQKPEEAGSQSIRVLGKTPPLPLDAAKALFLQLENVGLDAGRVYRVRDVSLDRAAFHITLDDGVLGFTSDVAGQVSGAFFEGEGEILLTPPNQVERASMMLQTGAAILEERFRTAYFRFNDGTFAELQALLTPAENSQEFASRWDATARNLAQGDALRLFMTFSRFLPLSGGSGQATFVGDFTNPDDRFLHARLQGETKGPFDVYFDSSVPEQVWAGQLRTVEGADFYDVWTSFSFLPKSASGSSSETGLALEEGRATGIKISACKIRARITPPTTVEAEAVLDLQVGQGGQRAALFELARTLVIKKVEANGQAIEFIHNPSVEGTQLARRGDDLVVVVLPELSRAGQSIKLSFVYSGEVLSEVGPGLLYVGARGAWYPNRGLAMTNFDLEFRYPAAWTLVATGKRVESEPDSRSPRIMEDAGEQVSRWVSERPIPLAGFNLGKYRRAVAQTGNVTVEAYGTDTVERGFPQPESREIIGSFSPGISGSTPPLAIAPPPPSPARNAEMVAGTAAQAIEFYSHRFGQYPFGEFALTQMPGNLSQGWPGLVFLSSLSFLNAEQKSALHMDSVEKVLVSAVIAHETAHQWWGDLVMWNDYRDQWISEGLANYSSMMLLEAESPRDFRAVMIKYKDDLLKKNKSGVALMVDGPVTLGTRLSCSQFPQGYEAISYGRGTWLFHMLRTMMRDSEPTREKSGSENEPFVRALRRLRERYAGKPVSTREMLGVFQEDLPRSLWYDGHKSLDWFYDEWVNGTAIPRFELRGVKYADKESATIVTGTILQKDGPNDLVTPVPLYAVRGGKLVFLKRVFADGPETSFHVTAPLGTRSTVLDPNQTLLARTR